jgi:membrane protein implicated in regulation of membrane protease activity
MPFVGFQLAIIASLLLLVLVTLLWLRKRFRNNEQQLVGASAHVETTLSPDGTVIVGGELWPARSSDGLIITRQRGVKVVGVDALCLVVEACD